ncbi:carbohydrate kinase [Salimicrobium salexigens]|uniref:Pseudouridine kinase n=1 Tax=Salimicrobium salexigens TaxID=908941 RepID=A0ABY1KKK2_9BACI|nr:carbohydrate kinase [Salimicrobium salexigens]SIS45775.1 pseudouridine kinase [Salimicrobium salexigens]
MLKDQRILELIKENPFITQQQLSEKLNLSRSAVAGYISTLTKKGEIVGRAYVLKEESKIFCIGGANIDRKNRTLSQVQYGTSNPVSSLQSLGGVARNVAENLGKLTCDVSLIALTGEDQDGEWLMKQTKQQGVDVSQSFALNGEKTGAYTSILDSSGELVLAVADMELYDRFTAGLLEAKWPHIASSEVIFADTNLPEATLSYLIQRADKEDRHLWIHTVSTTKMKRLPEDLSGVGVLFINREEAAELTGVHGGTKEKWREACELMIRRGVSKVVIHLDTDGVFVRTDTGEEEYAAPYPHTVEDGTGVKEAFISGMLFGYTHEESFRDSILLGMAAAAEAWQSKETVAALSKEKLYNQLQS